MNVAGELVCLRERPVQQASIAGLASGRESCSLKGGEDVGNSRAIRARGSRQSLIERRDNSRLNWVRVVGGIVVHHDDDSGECGGKASLDAGWIARTGSA